MSGVQVSKLVLPHLDRESSVHQDIMFRLALVVYGVIFRHCLGQFEMGPLVDDFLDESPVGFLAKIVLCPLEQFDQLLSLNVHNMSNHLADAIEFGHLLGSVHRTYTHDIVIVPDPTKV